MKLAHSNLLGEYVDAAEVEHADTAGFQIVCPCCAESVFKVARPLPDGRLSQFFSHRQAPPVQVTECELRVGGIARGEMQSRNAEARGQTLRLFQEWMRSALVLDRWVYEGRSPSDAHRRVAGLETYAHTYDHFRRDQVRLGADNVIEDELRQMQEGLDGFGVALETSFDRRVRERIVGDMVRTLLTPEGQANHAFLFRHTVLRMHVVDTRLRALRETVQPDLRPLPDDVSLLLASCVTRNQREAVRLRNAGLALGDPKDTDRFYRMVTMAMLTDLSRIPYAEMLANHRAGLRPLHGIVPRSEPDAIGGIRTRHVSDEASPPAARP